MLLVSHQPVKAGKYPRCSGRRKIWAIAQKRPLRGRKIWSRSSSGRGLWGGKSGAHPTLHQTENRFHREPVRYRVETTRFPGGPVVLKSGESLDARLALNPSVHIIFTSTCFLTLLRFEKNSKCRSDFGITFPGRDQDRLLAWHSWSEHLARMSFSTNHNAHGARNVVRRSGVRATTHWVNVLSTT